VARVAELLQTLDGAPALTPSPKPLALTLTPSPTLSLPQP